MSEEDLGPEASKQDWSDLQTLREDLRYWEESMSHLLYPIQEVNRWSQVPPRSKEISCFHASAKVRMYKTIPGAPQYKRMENWSEETSSAQDDTGEIGWNQAKARSALWNVS